MTFNFAMQAMDHIINSAPRRFMSGGQMARPWCSVARTARGPRRRPVQPGLRGMVRADPRPEGGDALLRPTRGPENRDPRSGTRWSSLEKRDHVRLQLRGSRPKDFTIPFGKARIARPGKDVTIISFGIGMSHALAPPKAGRRRHRCRGDRPAHLRPIDYDTILNRCEEDQPLRDRRRRVSRSARSATTCRPISWKTLSIISMRR